jgi:hypothetical protein
MKLSGAVKRSQDYRKIWDYEMRFSPSISHPNYMVLEGPGLKFNKVPST